jgi:hypothetical protein
MSTTGPALGLSGDHTFCGTRPPRLVSSQAPAATATTPSSRSGTRALLAPVFARTAVVGVVETDGAVAAYPPATSASADVPAEVREASTPSTSPVEEPAPAKDASAVSVVPPVVAGPAFDLVVLSSVSLARGVPPGLAGVGEELFGSEGSEDSEDSEDSGDPEDPEGSEDSGDSGDSEGVVGHVVLAARALPWTCSFVWPWAWPGTHFVLSGFASQ